MSISYLKNKMLVTIVMPTYNSGNYLEQSIGSILNQTLYQFQFIIIDDNSTDNSREIIYSFNDKRIKYYKNKNNLGVAKSLNIGLKLSKSKYISRMDADDIAFPSRIEKQIIFMESNLDLGLCGTYFKGFGESVKEYKHPIEHQQIKASLLKFNPLGHPTTIFRKALFERFKLKYNTKYKYCEDYELWTRAINFFKIANIPEILLYHRKHRNQISYKHNEKQKREALQIRKQMITNHFY